MARYTTLLLLVCAVCMLSTVAAFHLSVENDVRGYFRIETFGFFAGGKVAVNCKNFKIDGADPTTKTKVAFVIKHVDSDTTAFTEDNENHCRLYYDEMDQEYIIHPTASEFKTERTIQNGLEGFYTILFVNCESHKPVSFELDLELYNPGPNYLSAGLSPLPTMYFLFFLLYVIILAVWLVYVYLGVGKKVYRIHHLMSLLIVLKVFSLFFKSVEYHFKKTTGHPGGWAVAYYIFAAFKGITTFVVIALIGTGWAFIKPYLSEKDKKIFIIVIPLQIISNVAMVIIEEAVPGSQGWFTWKEIFRLVDIICCGAILVPIIWSIKHLRDAAQIDGKAKKNMEKLKLFRQFYLLVVTYIYFTRIIVYLLDATLSFRYSWLGELFTEAATVIFWSITGYKFRPIESNPFLEVSDDEGDEEEIPMDEVPLNDNTPSSKDQHHHNPTSQDSSIN
eukprot:TRINITY_DN738_c0_g1_i1.p1 TRINITY_DN738_c0_g1~~TRINITY_DN738_c0_g1_i1.p1  ORF type:complete len:448 (-),score=64.69 TRINITY_DN738_c0_g1_i1:84-1427(-)